MLGKEDKYEGHSIGFNNGNLIRELKLSNLIEIATNPALRVQLNEEYLEKLQIILKRIAEEKIDRTLRVIEQLDSFNYESSNKNR